LGIEHVSVLGGVFAGAGWVEGYKKLLLNSERGSYHGAATLGNTKRSGCFGMYSVASLALVL
jgi:hypothetical protein